MYSGKNMGSWMKSIKSAFNKAGWKQWLFCICVGILFMVIAWPVTEQQNSLEKAYMEEDTLVQTEKNQMEIRLEKLLSNVEGVGRTEVLLMTKETEKISFSSAQTYEVSGVLVVAEGAGNAVTERKIQQAVMALFQLEAHKIKVMKMK